jgi:hypothetical protein
LADRRFVLDVIDRVVGIGVVAPVSDRMNGSEWRLATVESNKCGHELVVSGVVFGACLSDHREDLSHGVDHRKERVGDLCGHRKLAVAKFREQVLADVGDRLKRGESEETGCALDRVDAAEDTRQRVGVVGLLERNERLLELIEVLVALDDELADDLVHVFETHDGAPGVR